MIHIYVRGSNCIRNSSIGYRQSLAPDMTVFDRTTAGGGRRWVETSSM